MAPVIGLTMVGFGTTSVVISTANYLIDVYSKYAASALGAVGLVENIAIAFSLLPRQRCTQVLDFSGPAHFSHLCLLLLL